MGKEVFKFKLESKTFVIIDWANVHGWFSDLGWEIDPQKLFDYLRLYPDIVNINFYFGVELDEQKSVGFNKKIEGIGYTHKSKEVKWVPASLETTKHFKSIIQRLFNVLDNVKNTNSDLSNRLYELSKKVERLPKISIDNDKTTFQATNEGQLKEIFNAIEGLDNDLKKLNIDISELQEQLKDPVWRRKCDFDVEISRDVYNNLKNFETLIIFSGDGDYAALVEDLILKGKKIIVVFAPGHKGKEYGDFRAGLFLCSVKKLRQFIAK